MNKFLSRKLLLTSATILVVVAVNLSGVPLDESTLESITTMVLGLVGAQGLVDFGEAWKAGTALAGAVDE